MIFKSVYFDSPEHHYAGLDVSNLVVLDIGAGYFGKIGQEIVDFHKPSFDQDVFYPNTTDYWRSLGASKIIAVDKESEDLAKLNADLCINIELTSSKQIEDLLYEHKPDFVKCDIEGFESLLFKVADDAFQIPKLYAVETHSEELFANCLVKLAQNNYSVDSILILEHTEIRCRVVIGNRSA